MDRIEIKEMSDKSLKRVYQTVSLAQVALPSLGLLLIAAGLIFAFSVEFSLWGNFGEWAIPIGIPGGGAMYLVLLALSTYLIDLPAVRDLNRMLVQLFANIGWAGIILLSVLAGVGEELLFRVFLQNIISDWLGWGAGLFLSSLLFGLAHYVSKLYVAITFAIGLVLGAIYWQTQSAVVVMTIHFFYDLCAFTLVVKYPHKLRLS